MLGTRHALRRNFSEQKRDVTGGRIVLTLLLDQRCSSPVHSGFPLYGMAAVSAAVRVCKGSETRCCLKKKASKAFSIGCGVDGVQAAKRAACTRVASFS